jgi:hypothetical protein
MEVAISSKDTEFGIHTFCEQLYTRSLNSGRQTE